jgi:hypothetical protein
MPGKQILYRGAVFCAPRAGRERKRRSRQRRKYRGGRQILPPPIPDHMCSIAGLRICSARTEASGLTAETAAVSQRTQRINFESVIPDQRMRIKEILCASFASSAVKFTERPSLLYLNFGCNPAFARRCGISQPGCRKHHRLRRAMPRRRGTGRGSRSPAAPDHA